MRKVGRNEPCPCGSGKKYKFCCLLDEQHLKVPLLRDTVSALAVKGERSVRQRYFDTDADIRQRRKHYFRDLNDDIDKTADRLLEHLASLEASCHAILARHSPVFWLLLERCLPHWFDDLATKTSSGQALVRLIDRSQLYPSLILKHAAWHANDLSYRNDQVSIEPVLPDIADFFGTIHRIFLEIGDVLVIYRRVAKGAKIQVTAEGHWSTVHSELMERCSDLYSERRLQFSENISPVGLLTAYGTMDVRRGTDYLHDKWSMLSFVFNTDRKTKVAIPSGGYISGPTFAPEILSLAFFEQLEPFDAKVQEATGLTLRQLRLCLLALKQALWDKFGTALRLVFLTSALLVLDPLRFHALLERSLERLLVREGDIEMPPKTLIARFITMITCTEQRARSYDALVRKASGCMFTLGGTRFLDVSMLHVVILECIRDLQLDSKTRQIKGSHLEAHVARQLLKDVPNIRFPFRPGLKLRKKGERDAFAEVDVYVAWDCLLLLIDCKAYSLTRVYFAGARKAVENRWVKVNQWLDESDARAKQIAENPEGANYSIPRNIKHVVAIVCSAFPEYFWDFEDHKFLVSRQTPRVCTYPELKQFLLSCTPAEVAKRAFAYKIVARQYEG